jgi:hypothetical protein
VAHLHFKRTVYRSGGGTASKRLEYITRQPERDLQAADRQLRYLREDREGIISGHCVFAEVWLTIPHV